MNLIFNGQLLSADSFSIPLKNRAFNYGDGIFETLIGNKQEIRFLNDHLVRLKHGLNVLKINCPNLFLPGKAEKEIKSLIESNKITGEARIRIMAWRKEGGLFSPDTNEGEYLINAIKHTSALTPKRKVLIFREPVKTLNAFSRFKTLSSLPYVMAGVFKKEQDADDVILLDTAGNVSECLNSNIFWIKGDFIFTPSLFTACIDGVMRKQIIQKLGVRSLAVIEGEFPPKDLMEADFAFTSNIAGLIPILSIEGKELNKSNTLFKYLAEELNP